MIKTKKKTIEKKGNETSKTHKNAEGFAREARGNKPMTGPDVNVVNVASVEKPRLPGPYHPPTQPANDVNDDTDRHNPGTIVFF